MDIEPIINKNRIQEENMGKDETDRYRIKEVEDFEKRKKKEKKDEKKKEKRNILGLND